ncbi:Rrf2 family transcriptional regulator [Crossiella sp. CA-258035]|uniref:RrF2 family transcriptional regulator n=1 Tax=Crossiella sp. CA-258035 TaxID=2981138 RepID=UPI0024BD211D|nr:Rrf2 family transcriptional regulator [Crossiella sp. CA-258035]WHT16317.1 Rrf2 family transcriptional regulator [Crossiella sp. CA-258035]
MRMGKGVEWALHTLLNLNMAGPAALGTGQLARAHGLPAPYLNKQLQQLVRAGLLVSTAGSRGGFTLAKPLTEITLLDVVLAIEGNEPAFRCEEIRCGGRIGELSPKPTGPCQVKSAMLRAEQAWREALSAQTLADIQAELDQEPAIRTVVRSAVD